MVSSWWGWSRTRSNLPSSHASWGVSQLRYTAELHPEVLEVDGFGHAILTLPPYSSRNTASDKWPIRIAFSAMINDTIRRFG